MAFASLGSGSRGNGTVVSIGGAIFLIDCGFTLKQTEARLARLGISAGDLEAILVSHEHADHVSGVAALAHKYAIPVHASYGTLKQVRSEIGRATPFDGDVSFEIGEVTINPVCVPHDAREPTQFVLAHDGVRVGVLSDLGCVTQHVTTQFLACDYLLLEANHDRDMLRAGSYPPRLKRRVGADYGHLSNEQSHALLTAVAHPELDVVIGHVSEQNNCPELLAEIFVPMRSALRSLQFATQEDGFSWIGERPLSRQVSFDQVM
jgi:phosphoribosyl 1,2-cyclic phosphodiesterase